LLRVASQKIVTKSEERGNIGQKIELILYQKNPFYIVVSKQTN